MVIATSNSGGSVNPVDSPPVTIGGMKPVYIEQVDMDLNGNNNTITDQCGHTEVRRSGNKNWNVAVQGLVTDTQLETLQLIAEGDNEVEVQADLLGSRSGKYVVDKCAIKHTDDINTWMDSVSQAEQAYSFNIQFKAPGTEGNSGG